MAAQGEPQPAFMYEVKGKRKALAHTFFVKTMKQMLEYIGERPMDFSGHSLRRGGATLAFSLGASTIQVMALGDWASLAVLGYNETEVDFLQSLPRQMADLCHLKRPPIGAWLVSNL